MTYPSDALFDIETLVTVAQAEDILLIGDIDASFLDNYREQKRILGHRCIITQLHKSEIETLWEIDQRFDVAIAIDLFEHLDKTKGQNTS